MHVHAGTYRRNHTTPLLTVAKKLFVVDVTTVKTPMSEMRVKTRDECDVGDVR